MSACCNKFWQSLAKTGNLIPNKKIVVSILKPIERNLNGTEFLKILENNIYSELDKF